MEPKLVNELLEAISFAARAHQGQMRKDKATPYVAHVFRVTAIVRNLFGFADPRMLKTAILHDTLEDTTTDCDDIIERHGPEVAHWVALLTKDKRLPDEEREAAYCSGLTSAPWQVKACKLADVYDNLLDSLHLPPEKREKTLGRAIRYLQALDSSEPELQKPLEIVRELLRERTASIKHPA